MEQTNAAGKKIFFLYPHSVLRDEMLDILIMNGYESYTLLDHKRARLLLQRFPDSIMFINIDQGLEEREWESYIKEIQENPKTKETRLGILSYNTDHKLMEKYLMRMSVPCGYIQLKLGIQASTKIVLDALQANEAKGRRKFIRTFCEDDITATMNYRGAGGIIQGKLLDISAAGIAARFERVEPLKPNSRLQNVQLKLRGSLVMTNTIVMGIRQGDVRTWILLFEPNMKPESQLVIHHYIKQCLQRYIDGLTF
jgi:hypothetical protein